MAGSPTRTLGEIVAILRYPVKSMLGEELNAVALTSRGLVGDRGFALIAEEDGKVGSAKNPKRWPRMFDFQAAYAPDADGTSDHQEVFITLPDGTVTRRSADDVNHVLSRAVGRPVALRSTSDLSRNGSATPVQSEGYWPDVEGMPLRDEVSEFTLPEGTFFDGAVLHLLTTATLDHLRAAYPGGRFEARRFRPNFVVQTSDEVSGFVENEWVGSTLAVGDEVVLEIFKTTGRCIMTTLPQRDLPRDLGILKTAADLSEARVGVYATVTRSGRVTRGDTIRLV